MTNLRKAAEQVLKAWDKWKAGPFEREMEDLRQALAQHNDYLKHALEEEWRNGYRAGKQEALCKEKEQIA